jgi:RHS repeat-associated protein
MKQIARYCFRCNALSEVRCTLKETAGRYTAVVTATDGLSLLTATSRVTITAALTDSTRSIAYTYDPLGRLVAATDTTGESSAYAYDAVGNRTVLTDTAGVHTYTYDAANRLTGVDGVSYTWDARGNLRSNGVFTYTYDGAGHRVRAESVSATVVYTYGLDSLLVGRSAGGAAATYAWDWATGVPEMLSDGERLYLVGQETLGWADGAEWAYPLGDALGSVRQVMDGAGEVLDDRSWTPFGVEEETAQGGLGYTGEWWDAEVSLLYLRARWYDPTAGRFTQRDPWEGDWERPQTLNPYEYVEGNVVNTVDPAGLCTNCTKFDVVTVGGTDSDGLAVRSAPSVEAKLLLRIPDGTSVMIGSFSPQPDLTGGDLEWQQILQINGRYVGRSFLHNKLWVANKYLFGPDWDPSAPWDPNSGPDWAFVNEVRENLKGFKLGNLFENGGSVSNGYGGGGFGELGDSLRDTGDPGHNGVDLRSNGDPVANPCDAAREVRSPVDGSLLVTYEGEPDRNSLYYKWYSGQEGITLHITDISTYGDKLEVQLTHVQSPWADESVHSVKSGDPLGPYAMIGFTTAPHLHVSMKWRGWIFDPTPYLPAAITR